MKGQFWTDEEIKLLKKIWLGKHNLKRSLSLFPGRSYSSLTLKAHKLLLGPRPFPDRSNGGCYVWAMVERELKNGDGSVVDIAKRIGVTPSGVGSYLRPSLTGDSFHISGWYRRPQGGECIPIYSYGKGEDAPKLPSLTKEEIAKRRRDARKKELFSAGARPRFVNPFAAAAGLVAIPSVGTGRVYQQSMSLRDFEEAA
jgi:hypothetical protein